MQKTLNIGSVVYATEQGLGRLAKAFYDNGVISKVLIQKHSRHDEHTEWYQEWKYLHPENYNWFLEGLDAVLFLETPFDWKLLIRARERGIKTILMPDECTPYPLRYEPDIILCPSLLEMEYNKDKNAHFIPFPITYPWKLREKARVFIHNAGHGGLGGRNGTQELLNAMPMVKSPIELRIRTQSNAYHSSDPRVTIDHRTLPYGELFTEGDVFIFPDKFAGLSLPLQEAFSAGLLVMTTDRFPLNTWLPKEPLIPVERYQKEKLGVAFDYAIIDPSAIASKIDEWYNTDITQFSLMGKEFGQRNTWQNFKDKLQQLL